MTLVYIIAPMANQARASTAAGVNLESELCAGRRGPATHVWASRRVNGDDLPELRRRLAGLANVYPDMGPDAALRAAGLHRPPSGLPEPPPSSRPDMDTLAMIQHRVAWTPPAVNPPYDYREFNDTAALRDAGVRVPDDGVSRRVTTFGDDAAGRGFILIERWTAPDGTRWERRTARRFDGPDASRSHGWREVAQ